MRPHTSLASLASLLAIAIAAPGCDVGPDGPQDPTLLTGESFVAIPRDDDAQTLSKRAEILQAHGAPSRAAWASPTTGGNFYLAIRKDALADKWFLSAFLKQYFPGGVNSGAANSLGTRVVSFKIQNDKLYVFDVDDRKASSDVFDPELLVEAYPIVTGWKRFEIMRGARDYVLIDPAGGLNRFGVVGDAFGSGLVDRQPQRFELELSFMQNFRTIDDGITYEHVFSGYSEEVLDDSTGGVEEGYFRGSGTLGIALRKYKEGDHYSEVEMPGQEHYFRSSPRVVRNQGGSDSVAAHWDIYEGMTPIKWHISHELVKLDEEMEGFELVAAVRTGIEGWNDALGFVAFETVLAGPDESFADDDKNYVIFDPDPSLGYAFANWRTNPNTGEIRGASIYFGRGWILDEYFPAEPVDAETDPEDVLSIKEKTPVTQLVWDSMRTDNLCVYWAPSYRSTAVRAANDETAFTNKETVEIYLSNMVAHEIGHTLSLRHNFMGSILAPSSSVMDYNNFEDSLAQPLPGSYDVAAVQYLYGLSTELPADPFCTDGDYFTNPDCAPFDTGADPLGGFHTAQYQESESYFLEYGYPVEYLAEFMNYYGQGLLGYARAGYPEQAEQAWHVAMDKVAAPLDPALLEAAPFYGESADALATWVLSSLLLSEPQTRGYISNDPYDPYVVAQVLDQAGKILENVDGIRSYDSRRTMVDLLKSQQSTEAYLALRTAREAIELQRADPALTAEDAALLADLLARLDAAISPYFD